MDILILGNGFDLAHRLKTSYKDFLESCSSINLQDIMADEQDCKRFCENNLWLKHFITRQKELGDTWIDLENEIYDVISKTRAMKNSGMVRDYSPKVLTVPKSARQFNFINITDFLNETRSKQVVGEQGYIEDFNSIPGVNRGVTEVYIETPKGFVNYLYDQLRDFTRAFENYLTENINLKSKKCSPYFLQLPANTAAQAIDLKVISFNYTNICEALYHSSRYHIKTIYVHGKVNTDDCNLVLGTKSFDRKNNENHKNLSINFNVFQKHNQRHKYGTIESYQDFLKEITNPKKIIKPVFHVIGHSLDETDHNLLKHIFTENKNSVINIYYHDEAAQEKLINNITNIIGEAEVMTKVRLIHQHDEKRGLLLPIKK